MLAMTTTLPSPDEDDPAAEKAEQEPTPLSEEEQMAAFEDALKESDWGHQPC